MAVAVLRQICELGHVVFFGVKDGRLTLFASRHADGEGFCVPIDGNGEDVLYEAACELAVLVGIEALDA